MSNDLFGNSGGTPNAIPSEDPIKAAIAGTTVGFGTPDLPLGEGVYELDKFWTGVSKKDGTPHLRARYVCVEHTNPACKGRAYQWTCNLTGSYLNMIYERVAKFFILPFGEAAKAQINSEAAKVAIHKAWTGSFKTEVETQTFMGRALKGTKVRINGVESGGEKKRKNGSAYTNYFFDCV